MKKAVIYARVSSERQEVEGFSIPAQLKLLRDYAHAKGFQIVREFVNAESAKEAGRKEFGQMVRFFEQNPDCRVALVEKTDRLYRDPHDWLTLDDLAVELHLVKEGRIINKNSKSQDKFLHGLFVLLAKNSNDNLREEVKKGMHEKASQGIYPSRAPFGYKNNKGERTIEVHEENARILKRIFHLYAAGTFSLSTLRRAILHETGLKFTKGSLHIILRNVFYSGFFMWGGVRYKGNHELVIEPEIFQRVQALFDAQNRQKKRVHEFALSGLCTCARCGCALTAELQKGRYIYYRCTGYKGKCGLRYFREEVLVEMLGETLKSIQVPETVVRAVLDSLGSQKAAAETERQSNRQRLTQRLADVKRRRRTVYTDKVDGKVTDEFWRDQDTEWQEEERRAEIALHALEARNDEEVLLTAERILELAKTLYPLYLKQNSAQKGKLLKMVLLNCTVDNVSVRPTYRKPFDLIFGRVKNEEWSALEDDFRTLVASGFAGELPYLPGEDLPISG